MTNEYKWERRTGSLKSCWELRRYTHNASWVIGTIRKQKRDHRCRKWIVAVDDGWQLTHVCVLYDMKAPDALEAARMILLSLKQGE